MKPGVDAERSWRWVFIPLGLFALSRVFSTLWLLLGAQHQVALPKGISNHVVVPTSAAPGYLGVISNWDGQWYRSIAETGYPALLPNEMGRVMANEWAFLPGYPMVVRLVMEATGLSFPVAATVVSLTSASLAVVLLYGMVMRWGGHPVAFTAVLAVCVYPTSPVLQLPYAESLALLLVLLALALLGSRRYLLLIPVCLALALTRQVVLAVAVVLLVHGVARWLRRREDPVPPKEWLALIAAAAVCVSSTMLWPGIAAVVTGVPDAYLRTYSAWWPEGSSSMLSRGWIGTSIHEGGPVASVTLVLAVYVLYVAARATSRLLGPELRVWSVAYPFYLLAVTGVGPSLMRYFLLAIGPLVPLPWAPSTLPWSGSERVRWAFIGICAGIGLALQYVWVTRVFIIGGAPQWWP